MEIEIKADNRKEVLQEMEKAIIVALEKCGMAREGYAKDKHRDGSREICCGRSADGVGVAGRRRKVARGNACFFYARKLT